MKEHQKLVAMIQIALLAALTAVLSQLAIPMPTQVPLTLQTFAVALAAYFGGVKKGLTSIAVYLALGAVGIPVFANQKGGFGVLIGFTGGFLWGFLVMALLCGIGIDLIRLHPAICIALGIVGLGICHLMGSFQYMLLSSRSFPESFMLVSFPYLLKDIASVVIAFFAAMGLRKALKAAGLQV